MGPLNPIRMLAIDQKPEEERTKAIISGIQEKQEKRVRGPW